MEEEKIIQWILRELKEVYRYSLDLIKLEEKINIGSKIGLADISVNIYRKKVKAPYILVETKRWGSGIDGALNQLKSYLSNCPSAQYGIATDGNELVIINRDLEEISDIPKFDISMIPSTLETIEFIDIRKNISHKFMKDSTVQGEVYIDDNGVEKRVANLRGIPVYNEIAAGMPILINSEFQGKYFLPSEWLGTLSNLFILKIKGEPMINKNINDGDYVVINKQSSANIGDIVAADIEGDATLKTYKTMGGKILLMPENDDYEPIMLEEEQFSIIGVAVGIIKEN
ncbi:transcriptional repressor LexA [Clostridium paraputrificum]|uniref:transcriptional repressor LexA n=1 Tax=Clostridium paraputrificum TaxID=29363 RepID=UPI002481906B|nr:transcriptional repressor LexA [Clostridium paraputrificum]MDB2086199.1 transcriptional repressor LexA [Clostridium paraputrificum]